jgi:uncharacterized protein DUF1905
MTPERDGPALDLAFDGEVIQWRGPSPYWFVAMPEEPSAAIRGIANAVSYGWECIPVLVHIDETVFTTALIAKDGRYLVPLKGAVRMRLGLSDGHVVAVELTIGS